MAKPDKRLLLIEWFKLIQNDSSLFTRGFFQMSSLFDLYTTTKSNDFENLLYTSFKRLVDSICTHQLYKNETKNKSSN